MNENAIDKKETPLWKTAFWCAISIVSAFMLICVFAFTYTHIAEPLGCSTLQAANTAPGFQYGYNFWTGCRVHIPSGLWVPQSDLDKYLAPDPAVHLPKEFLK